jgi:hypothetical protein
MTIAMPKKDFIDRLLALTGKERAVRIPSAAYKKYGPYAYIKAEKESLWSALTRPKHQKPPAGWTYPEDFIGL